MVTGVKWISLSGLFTQSIPGVSIEESARFGTEIERLLKAEFPSEIRSIWTRTGTPEVATDPMGIEVSDVFIMLRPRSEWKRARNKAELEKEIDRIIKPPPEMNYAFTQPIEMRFNEMIAGNHCALRHVFCKREQLGETSRYLGRYSLVSDYLFPSRI